MARVIGNPFGEFRGKLGGSVFSANKAGQIVRAYTKGTQPNTQAQIQARAAFGAVAGSFKTLTSVERTFWGQFAITNYTPKIGTNVGQYTAQQSFVGLSTAFSNSVRISRDYALNVNGAVLAGGDTRGIFIQPTGNPPPTGSAAMWDNSVNTGQVLNVTDGGLTTLGAVDFTLQVGAGTSETMTNFENPFGTNFGFAVYASNGNPNANMHYNNPEKYLLGYFRPPIATVIGDLATVSNITLTTTDPFDIGAYQQFPLPDQFVLLSIYMITSDCAMNRIGTVEVQMNAI